MSVFAGSLNQWCYGADRSMALPNVISVNGTDCYYSANTDVQQFGSNGVSVTILGDCIDLSPEGTADACIAEKLCKLSFDDFLKAIDWLLGIYVIFRSSKGRVLIFGDATHLMGVYYGSSGKYLGVAASSEALIINPGEPVSPAAAEVVRGAYSPGLYLAGDITMYESVKCLLPNHYLDVESQSAVRYFPREELSLSENDSEVNRIIDETFVLVQKGIRHAAAKYQLALPLTPGGDSRVNCALVRNAVPDGDVYYYVIRNVELKREPDNIKFIKELSEKLGIKDFHILSEADFIGDDAVTALRAECGPIRAWSKRLWCYNSALGSRAIVKGELIDQIGKSPYGRAMPEWMASKFFLKTILSNTSKQADKEFTQWYKAAKGKRMGYSMFDLYSWEVRCGRWNSNTHSIANILGVHNINFFNCTKILAEWCRIPRRERTNKCIHRRFISKTMPSVVGLPVNPYAYRHSRHLSPALSKIVPYWCRWIAQYVIQMAKDKLFGK